jgi:hypothetical protein|tara:strand:- start:320 stop:880 length:561 start_codon:yes stop_codon:yes gene_type:complete
MPLAFPNVGIQNMSMRLRRVVAVAESPFTLDTQVYTHQGARWEAEISLPPLTHAEARSVEGFIVGLIGREGTFTFGNPLHTSTATATLATAAPIRAETLSITNAGSAVSAGTYFQLGNYLYCVTADKASGAGTLNFQPPLREAIAISQACDFTLPKSTWRMSANDIGWSINEASIYGFTFACEEAL